VCLACSWYPSADNPYYGIFVHEFARRIRRAGAEVFIFTASHSGADKESDKKDGISVFRVKLSPQNPNPFRLLSFFEVFRKADIIHVHAVDIFGAISTLVAKSIGKPVVITLHRADVLPTSSLLFNLLRILALRTTDVAVAVSDATRNLALSVGAPKNKVVVVYNAVNESIFTPRSRNLCRSKLR